MGKVSVVLASYNGEKYIKNQINSIMSQLKDDDELIVSDDNSKDNTREIVLELANKDARIKLVNGPAEGYNKNFENAIKYAKNEFIFISDQDDEWMPDKVSKVLEAFDDRTNCVLHDCVVIDDNQKIIHQSYLNERKANTNYRKNIYKNTFTGCCMCVRREWLLKLVPFHKGIYYDAWIGILSCKFNCVKILNEPLIKWCRHQGTVTNLKRNSIMWIIKYRLRLMKELRRKIKTL